VIPSTTVERDVSLISSIFFIYEFEGQQLYRLWFVMIEKSEDERPTKHNPSSVGLGCAIWKTIYLLNSF